MGSLKRHIELSCFQWSGFIYRLKYCCECERPIICITSGATKSNVESGSIEEIGRIFRYR
jgi:hypothetical protein